MHPAPATSLTPVTWTRETLARTVDHTLLKPEATDAQVAALVAEAAELGAFSICVSPSLVPVEAPAGLAVCTVVGFPSGAHTSEVKAHETGDAVRRGATEVDMVVDLGGRAGRGVGRGRGRRGGGQGGLRRRCCSRSSSRPPRCPPEQVAEACRRSEAGGAQFVKTSTGFHPTGGALGRGGADHARDRRRPARG